MEKSSLFSLGGFLQNFVTIERMVTIATKKTVLASSGA